MIINATEPLLGKKHRIDPNQKIKLFSGTANPLLAEEIASFLDTKLSPVKIKHFADGEIYVQIQDTVRGHDVFVIQPTSTPVNESIMELMIMLDALRRASANTINVVVPYYGYARQDRKVHGREAITAKLVADILSLRADRVIAMDLHTGQLQGFFNIKTDHLNALPVFVEYFKSKNLKDVIVVSPDAGGVERARKLANRLDAPIAIIDKRRSGHNEADVYNLIGDVNNRDVIIIDDMIDTGGTICAGAQMLKDKGALDVYACATHAVFSGSAYEKLRTSIFNEVVVTNSIDASRHPITVPQIKCLTVAPLLGEAIHRIASDESVSELFD